MNNKSLLICIYIFLIILLVIPVLSYPSDVIFCNEDFWIKKVESSKKKIIASSILPTEVRYNYIPENVLDNNIRSCWCAKGKGPDQFIIMKIPKYSKGFKILNGVAATKSLYYENSRMKKLYWALIAEKKYETKEEEIHDSCKMSNPGIYNKYRIVFQTAPGHKLINLEDKLIPQIVLFSNNDYFSWDQYSLKKTKDVYLVIGILDIYRGTKYNDTCISEIEIIK